MQATYTSKVCYSGGEGGLLSFTWKVTQTPEGLQVLTSAVKALDMGFSASLLLQTQIRTKFIAPEAHFHANTIAASPTVIACKTMKTFNFLYSSTQHGPTIVQISNSKPLQAKCEHLLKFTPGQNYD